MNHKGTFYGIEFRCDRYCVTVGMKVVCDYLDTYSEAVKWIQSR